jgi:hypothetical protein
MTQELSNNSGLIQEEKSKTSPPYVSFVTFQNLITWLEIEQVPIKFDRSFWGKKFGGSLGVQLMAGLRFLGLLKEDFTQPEFGEIVKAKGEERNKLMAAILKKSYSEVDFSQLSGATPSMLKEWFAKYGLDGSTDRKARSFFINACKAYNVPLSNILKKSARNKQPSSTTHEKRIEKSKPSIGNNQATTPNVNTQPIPKNEIPNLLQYDLYKIVLTDGCELKLCSNQIFFEIEKADRELIEEIVEIMKKHRNQ